MHLLVKGYWCNFQFLAKCVYATWFQLEMINILHRSSKTNLGATYLSSLFYLHVHSYYLTFYCLLIFSGEVELLKHASTPTTVGFLGEIPPAMGESNAVAQALFHIITLPPGQGGVDHVRHSSGLQWSATGVLSLSFDDLVRSSELLNETNSIP